MNHTNTIAGDDIDSTLSAIEQRLRSQPDQLLEFEAQRDSLRRILELRQEKNALILG